MGLELSTQKERPSFSIDGQTYHFKTAEDLKYKEMAFLQYAAKRINKLATMLYPPKGEEKETEEKKDEPEEREEYSDEKAEELEELLHRAATLILYDVPNEVYAKLTDLQLLELVNAFGEAVNVDSEGSSRQTSTEPSHDSSGSTEATTQGDG